MSRRRNRHDAEHSRACETDKENYYDFTNRWNTWSVLVLYVTALISIESVVGIGLTVAVTLVSIQVWPRCPNHVTGSERYRRQ